MCVCMPACVCVRVQLHVYIPVHMHACVTVYPLCVCKSMHVCVCACMCPCTYRCVCVCVGLLTKRSPVHCPAAAVVSLSKELYSHCSSPSSYINGDLAIAGEANAKLCMSHLMVEALVGLRVPTAPHRHP